MNLPAVFCQYEQLTVTGNGTINTNENTDVYGAIQTWGDLVIENGTFNGEVVCGDYEHSYAEKGVIKNGTFNGRLYCLVPTTIENGKFDEVEFEQGGTINGGAFDRVSADSGYYYEYMEEDEIEELCKLTINGGTFIYTGDSMFFTCLETTQVDVVINGGVFENKGPDEIYGDCIWFDGDDTASFVINNGQFISPYGIGVIIDSAKKIEINGGAFKGFYGGLGIMMMTDETDLEFSGGEFITIGENGIRDYSRTVLGGITLVSLKTNELFSNTEDDFNKYLKSGYKYSPDIEVNTESNSIEDVVYSQKEIKVIRDDALEENETKPVECDNTDENETKPVECDNTDEKNNPKTGDTIIIWISLMLISMIGFIVTIKFVDKNKF